MPHRRAVGPRRRLAHFDIEAQIGAGAMGRVYRAIDLHTGQAVALKTLSLGADGGGLSIDDARDRFRREIEAARRLTHPDIVEVFEAGEVGATAYIAMELLSGTDLGPWTRAGQLLPVPVVLVIGARAAAALAHAHAQGVVHRDIKPANVMVDLALDQVKLTDFGVARVSDAGRTRTGLVLGSPLYMAPEQLAGQVADGGADIYALGLLIFQLLCGSLPFDASSMADVMQHASQTESRDIRDFRPDLPQDLADVISLCLQHRRELRYRRAEDLAQDLRIVCDRHFPDTKGVAPSPLRRAEP